MSTREERMWTLVRSVGKVLTELGRECILAAQEAEAERLAPPVVGERERELVVRWLNRQAGAQPLEKASTYASAADAIKAGAHVEDFERERVAMRAPYPDPAQAPTNPGHGPVPLFLDDDPEAEVFFPDVAAVASETERAAEQLLEPLEELAAVEAAWARMAFRAPETWSAEERQTVRRWHELKGKPIRLELEAEAQRLRGEQVRRGG